MGYSPEEYYGYDENDDDDLTLASQKRVQADVEELLKGENNV